MGWALAADLPPVPASDSSITVALIAALGTVAVALVGLAAQWLSRSTRPSQPPADPKLSGAAVVDGRGRDVDDLGDEVDKLRWEMDDMKAWRDQHTRRHSR